VYRDVNFVLKRAVFGTGAWKNFLLQNRLAEAPDGVFRLKNAYYCDLFAYYCHFIGDNFYLKFLSFVKPLICASGTFCLKSNGSGPGRFLCRANQRKNLFCRPAGGENGQRGGARRHPSPPESD
jgi:hypothetical protein